ncbi:MAG: hypothetical protein IJH25_15175 [Clostridia bacterium]|nr:hypothetical protein [Clostridia bacterium]
MLDKLKSAWNKVSSAAFHWFRRCNGADNLGMVIIVTSLIVLLLARITGLGLLAYVAMALYIWAMFRMFSHNKARRMEENNRFTQSWTKVKTEVSQAFNRLKNSRKYKYYRCPNCKARLRIPRGIGEKNVTCSQCKHTFKKKA